MVATGRRKPTHKAVVSALLAFLSAGCTLWASPSASFQPATATASSIPTGTTQPLPSVSAPLSSPASQVPSSASGTQNASAGVAGELPSSIAGHALEIHSGNAATFPTVHDLCLYFCGDDFPELSRRTGLPVDQITWAVALGQTSDDEAVLLRAVHVDGATVDLVESWVGALQSLGRGYSVANVEIDGRPLVVAVNPLRRDAESVLYLYAVDDTLFLYAGVPLPADPRSPPSSLRQALLALP